MDQFQHLHNLNVHSSCRTCLKNLNDIHHDIFAIPHLKKKYAVCTSLPVEPGDGYPTSLCEQCHTKIDDFFNFQQMCISARKRFQDYINSEEKPFVMEQAIDPINQPTDLLMFKKETTGEQEDSLTYDACLEFVATEIADVRTQDHSSTEEESDDDEPIIKYRVRNKENSLNNHSPLSENKDTTKDVKPADTVINLECEICKKIFKKLEPFTAHMRVHQGLKPFPCQLCDKSYSRRSHLLDHMRTKHEGKREHKLPRKKPLCYRAKKKQKLRKHIKDIPTEIDPNPKQPHLYICEECGKVLSSMATLKNHLYLHSGAQLPHECPQCQKRYLIKSQLKQHMHRHSGTVIKKYTCPHCGAKKSTRSELNIHINYHTKEKSYPCEICDRIFNSEGSFYLHRRIVHLGIKAYKCSYCDKSFSKAGNKKYHEMLHTGEKPFECNICHKTFIQPSAFKRHKMIHTGEKPHECNICHKRFIQSGAMKSHKKIHHKAVAEKWGKE